MSNLFIIFTLLVAGIIPHATPDNATQSKPEIGIPIIKNAPKEPISTDIQPAQAVEPIEPVVNTTPAPQPATASAGSVQQIIIDAANRYGVSPDLLLRIAKCESGFSTTAYNPSGATGLFQFMPATFYGNGGTNLYDAYDQANIAAKMFSQGQANQWSCK